jgi:hypothetical protein
MINDDIYLNPRTAVYLHTAYSCSSAEGGFDQIRLTQIKEDKDYRATSLQTSVLYSRSFGNLSISGWLDKDTVLFFLGEQPYRLKASSRVFLTHYQSNPTNFNAKHYPEDESGLLVQGLEGMTKVVLPRSNFSPDGNSFLVYSRGRKAILQKNTQGTELSATVLPDSVRYNEYHSGHPVFSPDGRHIAFLGLVKTDAGDKTTIYLADIK